MPPKPQKDKYTDSGRVGKLLILLQDASRQPIVRRSKVIVLGAPGGLRLSAVGKDKEVTRFTFELPAGDYTAQASAAGYENATLLVSMGEGQQREEGVVLKFQDRGKAGDGESGGRSRSWTAVVELSSSCAVVARRTSLVRALGAQDCRC
jgi:hypothetical protein